MGNEGRRGYEEEGRGAKANGEVGEERRRREKGEGSGFLARNGRWITMGEGAGVGVGEGLIADWLFRDVRGVDMSSWWNWLCLLVIRLR